MIIVNLHVNDNKKVVNMKSAGSNYGLKVLVEKNMEEIERYENNKKANKVGDINLKPIHVSVTLHNPKEPANIRNKGFEIPLGHFTKVYITPKAREIDDSGKDLTEIQRGCRLAKDSKDLDSFNIYSQESCHLECMIKQSYKRCGCFPWNYLVTEQVVLDLYSNCDAPGFCSMSSPYFSIFLILNYALNILTPTQNFYKKLSVK